MSRVLYPHIKYGSNQQIAMNPYSSLIYNKRTFNLINILKKLVETYFYSASEYIITLVWHVQGFAPTHEIWLQQTCSFGINIPVFNL